jgi:molecular chaperone DnaK (HSP70)
MPYAVGIDLGTTNSLVAWVNPTGEAVVLPNTLGEPLTPSVVCFRNGKPIVGAEAKEAQATGETGVAAFFKRQMALTSFRYPANGRSYSATELSSLVLASLKHDAEVLLGEPVTQAVITVPAYFRDPERKATLEAGRLAGLEVLQLINEPTAAALAYGVKAGAGPERIVCVYDLGGGTFDLTLLRIGPDELKVLSSTGDHELGGKDFDERIVQFLADRFSDEFGRNPLEDVLVVGDLLVEAEQAKRRLSTASQATVTIVHDGDRGRYELTRDRFEQITRDLLDRTLALLTSLLEGQRLGAAAIDGILLVGGSTRMPAVARELTRVFGKPPLTGINVDQAVALGAALCAQAILARGKKPRYLGGATGGSATGSGLMIGGRRTTDLTAHSLGMIAVNEAGSAYVNSLILPKDQAIPCRLSRPFQFSPGGPGEDRLEIFMTQGEAESPAHANYLGLYVLNDLPAPPRGQAALVIEVEYSYDESGSMQVAGRIQGQPNALRLTVEPLPPDVPARFLKPPPKPRVPHVTVYLGIDVSGSMEGHPLAEAKRAAHRFVEQLDLAHCSVGLITTAGRATVCLPACQNARKIARAIDGLSAEWTGSLADPFEDALKLMRGVTGPRFVVVLADGDWDNQDRAEARVRACHEAGVETIAVGFGDAKWDFLRRLASCDEGALLTSLRDLTSVFTGIAQVLTRTQGGKSAPPQQAKGGKGSWWGLLGGK